jgi:murein DD-endopeptidase MepM/ murein hydrolase activator NlpD
LNYTAVPPQNLAIKPLTGANPLKWILNGGERMIFPLVNPVDITSIFGWRVHPITGDWRFHSGTDLGAPMGTPVLAAYSGRVSVAEFLGGYGLSILLDHNQGKQETRYAHLSEVFVKPGQWVQQGTVIGLVGSTGNSTGPHLHFEALQATPEGMVAVDPTAELQTTMAQLAKALQTARLTAQQPTVKPKG